MYNPYQFYSPDDASSTFGGLGRARKPDDELSYSGRSPMRPDELNDSYSNMAFMGIENQEGLKDLYSDNPSTLREYMGVMNEFDKEKRDWEANKGVTMENFKRANLLSQEDGATARAYISMMPKWI